MFKDTVNEDSSRIEKWKESRKVVGSILYSLEIKYENKITEDVKKTKDIEFQLIMHLYVAHTLVFIIIFSCSSFFS